MAVHDVSLILSPDTPLYPGERRFECEFYRTIADGDTSNNSRIAMGSHVGTHIDAPLHFVAGGRTVDEIAPDALVGPCALVDVGDADLITRPVLEALRLAGRERILFRTKNSAWIARRFEPAFVAFSAEGARHLADMGPRLIGIDAPSLDPYKAPGHPAHMTLLGSAALEGAIEWLSLAGLEPGEYDLFCGPLPARGAEAAPCRVLLRRP